jgi:hypothetical protein
MWVCIALAAMGLGLGDQSNQSNQMPALRDPTPTFFLEGHDPCF